MGSQGPLASRLPFRDAAAGSWGLHIPPEVPGRPGCHTNHTVQVESWTLATHFFCPHLLFL